MKRVVVFLLVTQLGLAQQIFKKKQSLLGSPFEITVVAKDSVEGNYFTNDQVNEEIEAWLKE